MYSCLVASASVLPRQSSSRADCCFARYALLVVAICHFSFLSHCRRSSGLFGGTAELTGTKKVRKEAPTSYPIAGPEDCRGVWYIVINCSLGVAFIHYVLLNHDGKNSIMWI